MKINPANRISVIEEYYFSRKLAEVAKLQQQGAPIINLGIGNPDLAPHDLVHMNFIKGMVKPGSHGYQNYKGIPELRQAFAQWYKNIYKVEANADTEILPLIGSKEGILLITMAFVNPGETILVPDPGYPAYSSVANLLGAKIQTYNLTEQNNWMPDFNELEQLVDTNTKLMWINYPGMPTGKIPEPGLFQKLVAFTQKHNILLVNDNPYSLILNPENTSLLSVPGASENCIELNSLSKSHNLPGLRMGVAISNSTYIQYLLTVKSNYDSGMYKPSQEAAVAALALSDDWYKKNNAIYEGRRKKVHAFLDALHCNYTKQSAGLFVWAAVPESFPSGEAYADELLYKHAIFITPGSVFGKNGHKYIRISLCLPEQVIEEATARVINKY